jgi:hypothetical protein
MFRMVFGDWVEGCAETAMSNDLKGGPRQPAHEFDLVHQFHHTKMLLVDTKRD